MQTNSFVAGFPEKNSESTYIDVITLVYFACVFLPLCNDLLCTLFYPLTNTSMATFFNEKRGTAVRAYQGDAMTLLAFDFTKAVRKTNCVGFTIKVTAPDNKVFYLPNRLRFEPANADTDPNTGETRKSFSTLDCPLQKFRWLHVPASSSEGTFVEGVYKYEVTPRYWKNEQLQEIDHDLTVIVQLHVGPFKKENLQLSFTRGFMISQAYARRFGNDTTLEPDSRTLLFDTSAISGNYPVGSGSNGTFSYKDQYLWMGWQARRTLFDFLNEADNDGTGSVSMDVLAYDLDEPDICKALLSLAQKGKLRMILDDHEKGTEYEGKEADLLKTEFENAFVQNTGSLLIRADFARQAHCKVFIMKKNGIPKKVLTGSTNFSVNGLYVNANHVIVIENDAIALRYSEMFDAVFEEMKKTNPSVKKVRENILFMDEHVFEEPGLPKMEISFAPHTEVIASGVLQKLADKIESSVDMVLFSVMQLQSNTTGPVVPMLRELHKSKIKYTYGVTDSASGITVFKPDNTRGTLVQASKLAKMLPPPFDEELRKIPGFRIHHKFVVVDFNSETNAVVYCGSSNLALGGEKDNNDNLIAVYDKETAQVFAIEAIRLIDHYHFRASVKEDENGELEELFLEKKSTWLRKYFKEGTMKWKDREYFIDRS